MFALTDELRWRRLAQNKGLELWCPLKNIIEEVLWPTTYLTTYNEEINLEKNASSKYQKCSRKCKNNLWFSILFNFYSARCTHCMIMYIVFFFCHFFLILNLKDIQELLLFRHFRSKILTQFPIKVGRFNLQKSRNENLHSHLLVSCICCSSEDAAREIQDYAAGSSSASSPSSATECWLMTLVNKIKNHFLPAKLCQTELSSSSGQDNKSDASFADFGWAMPYNTTGRMRNAISGHLPGWASINQSKNSDFCTEKIIVSPKGLRQLFNFILKRELTLKFSYKVLILRYM